jgi:hypothetical protein
MRRRAVIQWSSCLLLQEYSDGSCFAAPRERLRFIFPSTRVRSLLFQSQRHPEGQLRARGNKRKHWPFVTQHLPNASLPAIHYTPTPPSPINYCIAAKTYKNWRTSLAGPLRNDDRLLPFIPHSCVFEISISQQP